jgi:hypothetical protein
VLFHQLGQDLVLGAELGLQGGDALLIALTAAVGATILEDRGAVLEELLQLAVEDRRMKAKFLTEIWKPEPSRSGAGAGWRLSLPGCASSVLSGSGVLSVVASLTAEHSIFS